MGQYYVVVNLDKEQYLHPHVFGDGLKLMEFGQSYGGTLTALTILLSSGNGRGGGDFTGNNMQKHPLVGSWAGDRIVVAGDYDDRGKWLKDEELQTPPPTLYDHAQDVFKDISDDILAVMIAAREFDLDGELFIYKSDKEKEELRAASQKLIKEYAEK